MSKVLFILKRREDYNAVTHSSVGLSTGLYNSASFVCDMLNAMGIEAKLEVVIDNNCIDKVVTEYKPTHVIIEALWVVPSKFAVLQQLHPTVQWIVRLHSEMPFMAGEGMSMDWIGDYAGYKNVSVGINAPRMLEEIKLYLSIKNNWNKETANNKVIYLPNYYPDKYTAIRKLNKDKDTIDVACFGAVRLLKNHLVQAFGAIKFANKLGKKLRFHINAGRIEMQGDPVVHNLTGLFEQLTDSGHQLINHQWRPREEFLELCSEMDIGLQVSFSETFNIVGADLISQGVPLVGTPGEIPWAIGAFSASPTSSDDIANKLLLSYRFPKTNVYLHRMALTSYTKKTARIWAKYFK